MFDRLTERVYRGNNRAKGVNEIGWWRDRWLEGKGTLVPVFQPHAPIHLDTRVGIYPVGFLSGRGPQELQLEDKRNEGICQNT